MTIPSNTTRFLACGLLALALMGVAPHVSAMPRLDHNHHGEVLDDRYHHGHYYVPRGTLVHELPAGYRPYWFHGSRFYFAGGVWYAPGSNGFIVARPPAGLVVSLLPPFYTTVWIAGTPYYYANGVYYRWAPDLSGYEIVNPPPGADQPAVAPAATAEDFYLYPKNGQTPDQQSADRYECHSWSKAQTGFDPTLPNGGAPAADAAAKREAYRRAMTACLEGRGYSVT